MLHFQVPSLYLLFLSRFLNSLCVFYCVYFFLRTTHHSSFCLHLFGGMHNMKSKESQSNLLFLFVCCSPCFVSLCIFCLPSMLVVFIKSVCVCLVVSYDKHSSLYDNFSKVERQDILHFLYWPTKNHSERRIKRYINKRSEPPQKKKSIKTSATFLRKGKNKSSAAYYYYSIVFRWSVSTLQSCEQISAMVSIRLPKTRGKMGGDNKKNISSQCCLKAWCPIITDSHISMNQIVSSK